ncbi:hypothetical protein HCH_01156 [Hahella chejuensis KCTC 2396]|uniref:Uncharacterized protein n=1 Tax=Hahella chejuensis (strain KCTC 2396) TaxID=349521 RepID=Q2SMU1_HAHCH|nr:hypothetical protein [Hahella chejuensis]ABC28033.1 hypothetical protein HCH_01156 [Hahella chejuensis KCTC 2396]
MSEKDVQGKKKALKQPEALTIHELEEIKAAMTKARKEREIREEMKSKGFKGHGG